MRICIFGAGSLGSALGALLAHQHEVLLVGRAAHVKAVTARGLRLTGDRKGKVRPEAVEKLSKRLDSDLVVITTKAYDTSAAIRALGPFVDSNTKVLTLQNGLGNLEQLRDWRKTGAFGGTTTIGASLVSPGVVRLSGLGKTVIGGDLDYSGARSIASAFSECGVPTATTKDVFKAIWSKAVVSACINPLSAVLRVENGRLLEIGAITRLMSEVCSECVSVAGAAGVRLSRRQLDAKVRSVAENTAANRSSMLGDIEHGRRTEIAQINGAFCRAGEENGVPTPLNHMLVAMIEEIESQYRTQKG